MPFTLAHPAAVVPIYLKLKKRLPLPSLVIGSMMPDVAYYFPMRDGYKLQAHTWLGAIEYCVPLGIAALLVFYWITPEIIFLLLNPERRALQSFSPPAISLSNVVLAFCGIVIGAETHVLWDSFTHPGWLVDRSVFLQQTIWGDKIPVFLALEFLSTAAGLLLLLFLYQRWLQSKGFSPRTWDVESRRILFWIAVFTGCLCEALIESRTLHAIISGAFLHNRHFVLVFITAFMRDFLLAICGACIGMKLLRVPVRDFEGLSHEKHRKVPKGGF